jgi:predicted nuclease of predicted toxin-antitoxin system
MKLLLDHNLSYKLVGRLTDMFPDAEHVRNVNCMKQMSVRSGNTRVPMA